MADWKTELDVSDVFYSQEWDVVAKTVSDRLFTLSKDTIFSKDEKAKLLVFSEAFETTVDSVDSFNSLWKELYDFADYRNRIWIKLF